jgi:hypothetical protein
MQLSEKYLKKYIEIKTNHTDYLFYAEDRNYLHFEFQTTDKKEDIGTIKYEIEAFYMKNINGDEKLQCLKLLYALFEKFGDEFLKNKFNIKQLICRECPC